MKTWAKITLVVVGVLTVCAGATFVSIVRSFLTDDSFLGLGKPVPGLDPGKTLRETTGLTLPSRAQVERFEYVSSLDDYFILRFRLTKADAVRFMRQKPFSNWQSHTATFSNPSPFWKEWPKPPFRATSVELPNARYLGAYVEERKNDPWVVWISWHET